MKTVEFKQYYGTGKDFSDFFVHIKRSFSNVPQKIIIELENSKKIIIFTKKGNLKNIYRSQIYSDNPKEVITEQDIILGKKYSIDSFWSEFRRNALK